MVCCACVSLVNHSCDDNAYHCYEPNTNVKLLISSRAIKQGEEITIAYQDFTDPATGKPPSFCREVLSGKWGIVCSPDCACYDKEKVQRAERARELDRSIMSRSQRGDFAGALSDARKLLNMKANTSLSRQRTFYDAFQLAVTRRATMKEAIKYAKEAYELAVQTKGPR